MDEQSPLTNSHGTSKFPSLPPHDVQTQELEAIGRTSSTSPHQNAMPHANGGFPNWHARRDSTTNPMLNPMRRSSDFYRHGHGHARHGRQKSLSEALRTIRTRKGSVSQNAHEIADALKAPVSPKLIVLCAVWYATSAMSNTSSKAILNAFPKPVTLTVIQFMFVSSWCFFLASLARRYPRLKHTIPILKYPIRPPTKDIVISTLPLTMFQIGGHILSSDATSRIPVSLVHTIKGLSPLFTVTAYTFLFNIRYSHTTWLSLIPLTVGVIMACSADFRGNFLGLLSAFGSAVLFVTQNIVSKKLFNEAAIAEAEGGSVRMKKPDKLNLLFYSSGLAFLITSPIWLWSEGFTLISDFLQDASLKLSNKPGSLDHGALALEYIFNGTFHFGQNLVAFVLLSMVSPVTYSVASLIKRVFVILFAIVWFGNSMSFVQGCGILLTFTGLYLYDRTSDADKADRKARLMQMRDHDPLLPLREEKERPESPPEHFIHHGHGQQQVPWTASPIEEIPEQGAGGAQGLGVNGYPREDGGKSRPRGISHAQANGWLAPGTKQEETWTQQEQKQQQQRYQQHNQHQHQHQHAVPVT